MVCYYCCLLCYYCFPEDDEDTTELTGPLNTNDEYLTSPY